MFDDGLHLAGNGDGAGDGVEHLSDGCPIFARCLATLSLAFVFRVARRNHVILNPPLNACEPRSHSSGAQLLILAAQQKAAAGVERSATA
jgi:hypothetical protein